MYTPRRKVFWFAVVSRATVISLQFIFNILCPDHQADAFRIPMSKPEGERNIISLLFGGLTRWDGQYFIHVARYGYTYENTLAFYPLYPMMIRTLANSIRMFFAFDIQSAIIVSALLINFICFVKSALIFYELSKAVLKTTDIAYKAAILYCINPASIFFSAVYSESLFAHLTYYSMLRSIKSEHWVFLPLGLSILVRSNGIINIAFPVYFELRRLSYCYRVERKDHSLTFYRFLLKTSTLQVFCSILNTIILSLAPFVLLQIYNYLMFCVPGYEGVTVPLHIADYAALNSLRLPGNGSAEWCKAKVPLAYSYIQNEYWKVGLFNYYELKQIPNFLLAVPVLYIMIVCIKEYFLEHKKYFCNLGFFESSGNSESKKYPVEMLAFIIHGSFLTLFCMLFVHIQVSTRLIMSASPLVCWYAALTMSSTSCNNDLTYEHEENISSKWRVFFLSQRKYHSQDKFILSYFLGYAVLGCFMFSNFLPWT